MGRNETPSWLDQPSEPEDKKQQSDLPPWLRDDPTEASAGPPPSAEEPALPPWLQKPDEEREMLRGEQLSDEWLSNADALVDSVDTELTYDEWQAIQKERARPKSIEEEIPDLFSNAPSEADVDDATPGGSAGELPDWFLGLEELDTSDAPDWFVGAAEEPPPGPISAEEPPSWISDLEQAQAEEPEPEVDAVDDFFSSLKRESTLPSGASMDDLFGEFAMSPPEETEAPDEADLDWLTGQPQASSGDTGYGVSEMDDFFRSLSRPTPAAPEPAPKSAYEEEELPDSSALLGRLPKEPEADDFPALNNLNTRPLFQQPTDFSQFLDNDIPDPDPETFVQAQDDEDEIEEPDLEWFTGQASPSLTARLPDIDLEPAIPEPTEADLYSADTVNWLSELENIVSSVTREEEPEVAASEDFFPEVPAPADEPIAEQPAAGRGDEFDWPEPAPYVESDEQEQPQNWFDQFNLPNVEPEQGRDQPVTPPVPRLTGMLNRIRAAEEASVPDVQPEEPSPEDDLDALFLTEDLLAEADSGLTSAAEEDRFDSSAAAETPEAESEWGDLDLDALISQASADTTSSQQAESAELEGYSFDSLFDGASAEQQPTAADEPDFKHEEDETPAPSRLGLTGLLSRVHLASLEEAQPSNLESELESASDLFESDVSDEVTIDDLYPAEWDPVPEPPRAADTARKASDSNAVEPDSAGEVYEPQWGVLSEPEAPPARAGTSVDFGAADGAVDEERYQLEYGAALEQGSAGASEPETTADTYEPQWGAVDEESAGQEWDSSPQPEVGDSLAQASDEEEAVEEGEDFGDMSWLTDDIFGETGGFTPVEDEQPAAEAEDRSELAAENAAFAADFALDVQAQPSEADEEPLFGLDYTVSWDTEADEPEALAPAEPAADDFLAELRNEQAAVSAAEGESDDYAILWEAEAEPSQAEAEAVPAEDDFLQMLQPETPTEKPEPKGFDDDFLASLDTLDQMQASGQSLVGDDLFPTLLEEPPQAAQSEMAEAATPQAADDLEAAFHPSDEDDDLDWLTADLEDEPELSDDFFGAPADQQPQAEPASIEQPTFDEAFFASLEQDETPAAETVPDLFASFDTAAPSDNEDDFFREMGIEEAADQEQPEMDWLTDVGDEQTAQEAPDLFGAFDETPAAAEDQPAWLRALNAQEDEGAAVEMPDIEDWFTDFESAEAAEEPAPAEDDMPQVEAIEDLDSYLASLKGKEAELLPGTKELLAQEEFDIDSLLEAPLIDEDHPPAPQAQPFVSTAEPGLTPDWLTDVHATVGEVSAGAMVRQRKDRPEGELDDRLKKLRQRADKVPAASAEPVDDSLSDVLPDVEDTLAPASIRAGAPSLVGTVTLSADQKERVALLKTLVSTEEEPAPKRLSAIEMTYDNAPYQLDLEEDGTTVVQPERQVQAAPAPRPKKRARRTRVLPRIRIDRLLITLLLAAGIIGPFLLPALRFGDLPAPAFVAGSAQDEAYTQLNDLEPGTLVLFAVEYSPASAAELDPMTDALLRHVLMQNAYPVVISGNPLALLRAGNLLEAISADEAFLGRIGVSEGLQPNLDYYVVRYIPGSAIGLRAFSADTARLLLTDIRGQTTRLNVLSLRDFPVIVVVTDRAEDVRSYAEQVAPLANASVIAAVSYSAAPLVEPYVNAEILSGPPALTGLLVGYGDAYTYNTLIGNTPPVVRSERRAAPIIRTTPEPTAVPPTPTFTATPRFTPTPTPTPTPAAFGSAVVTATESVNVRPEPNTNNTPIAQLSPGQEVVVLGFNDDRSWVNIRLNDGREGWVSAQLVDVEEAQSTSPKRDSVAKAQPAAPLQPKILHKFNPLVSPILQDADATAEPTEDVTEEATSTRRPTQTPRPTATPRAALPAEVTPEATPESTAEVTPEATAEAGVIVLPPHSPGYRDERWYAMTLGIIISASVITFGAVVNILRSLLRRGR